MLLHTLTYLNADPYPLWIPLITVMLLLIMMAPEDMEKTTFVTQWGTFCYKVMPFGLKNAGETYQRLMVALFHDMIHHEIEVYIDDMIARSQTEEENLDHLQKLFDRLKTYKLKLNPNKCTFRVRSGKLLGFIVNDKGIQVDPAKVKAIQDMPAPRTKKEVRGFLGRDENPKGQSRKKLRIKSV